MGQSRGHQFPAKVWKEEHSSPPHGHQSPWFICKDYCNFYMTCIKWFVMSSFQLCIALYWKNSLRKCHQACQTNLAGRKFAQPTFSSLPATYFHSLFLLNTYLKTITVETVHVYAKVLWHSTLHQYSVTILHCHPCLGVIIPDMEDQGHVQLHRQLDLGTESKSLHLLATNTPAVRNKRQNVSNISSPKT